MLEKGISGVQIFFVIIDENQKRFLRLKNEFCEIAAYTFKMGFAIFDSIWWRPLFFFLILYTFYVETFVVVVNRRNFSISRIR